MRISDWSSDVCSSDLAIGCTTGDPVHVDGAHAGDSTTETIGPRLDFAAASRCLVGVGAPLASGTMRAVVQRVTRASVTVGDEVVGSIGPGLCVPVGVTHDDDSAVAAKLAGHPLPTPTPPHPPAG